MATPTRRRSTRFQPIVSPRKPTDANSNSIFSWANPEEPLFTRPLNPEVDLHDEDREKFNRLSEDERRKDLTTRFYDELRVSATRKASKGKKATRAKEQATTFAVGDTVLVSSPSSRPSIGVIVDMWEIELGEEEEESESDEEGEDKIRVRVHWFDRPSDLPSVRARRYYHDNEIYYTVSQSTVLYPSTIISHCVVKNGTEPASQSQSKNQTTRSRAGTRYIMESVDKLDQEFQCLLAVDARQGIFYEFNWDTRREIVLETRAENEIEEEEWGTGNSWNVEVKGKKEKEKEKEKASRPSPRKRVKRDEPETDASEEERPKSTPKKPLPARKKSKRVEETSSDNDSDSDAPSDVDSDDDVVEEDELVSSDDDNKSNADEDPSSDDDEPKTRGRKRKRTTAASTSTPRKPRQRAIAQPTPHSKAALSRRERKRSLTSSPSKAKRSVTSSPSKRRITTLPTRTTYAGAGTSSDTDATLAALQELPPDPFLRAMHALHVGSRPDTLPCRGAVSDLLEEGSGGCIYISGVPGTGKTATVHAVIRELKRLAENNEINPFTYCEINGLRIPDPSSAYTLLWEVVSGQATQQWRGETASAKESLKSLTRHFSGGGGRGRGGGSHACVVLMDELDQLLTTKQDVVYNFFNWPTLAGSKLVVIALRAHGYLPTHKGMRTIDFQPYKTAQLEEIIKTRLAAANESLISSKAKTVLETDAIKFVAMKVGSISGDARRALDICRRTLELVRPKNRAARTSDAQSVIKSMQNSPTAAYLRECSLHERIMLASLLKCMRRDGVEEIKFGDVQYQHLIYVDALTSSSDPTRKPSTHELRMVLESLVASRALIFEDSGSGSGARTGTVMTQNRIRNTKSESERRVMLNLERVEVESVLFEMDETWKGKLGFGGGGDD
ncbi:hypothetical protein BT96DRAFT_960792 [Gymnopus androsaceus JB14]|uniref:Origin recognition complex subunit 1 n=1 Tax=Gymnopus androsaceus JB14 TaxID=1447944 RepID=A0A6A4GHY6_9AGAR|nr:hypothetical protein BT96DRAFT_960792 [Gymnopus androsaceus JB14]